MDVKPVVIRLQVNSTSPMKEVKLNYKVDKIRVLATSRYDSSGITSNTVFSALYFSIRRSVNSESFDDDFNFDFTCYTGKNFEKELNYSSEHISRITVGQIDADTMDGALFYIEIYPTPKERYIGRRF